MWSIPERTFKVIKNIHIEFSISSKIFEPMPNPYICPYYAEMNNNEGLSEPNYTSSRWTGFDHCKIINSQTHSSWCC